MPPKKESEATRAMQTPKVTLRQIGDGSSAIASFRNALNCSDFSDVTFLVRGEQFHAHRAILAARSPIFKEMLFGEFKEAREREVTVDFDPKHFYTVLEWAYTGIASMSAKDVLGVLHVAAFYNFHDLEDHCRQLAIDFIDVPNVVLLLDAAFALDEQTIITESLSFCQQHAAEVLQEPCWLQLCQEGVEAFLSMPAMDCDEVLLFRRTVDWINHAEATGFEQCSRRASTDAASSDTDTSATDAPTARTLLEKLLRFIRFPQLTTNELIDEVKPLVAGNAKVHYDEYVTALEFKLSPMHFDGSRELRFVPRTPTILSRIVEGVAPQFLSGWRLLIEREAPLNLPTNIFDQVPRSATYICVGERPRVGSSASATPTSSSQPRPGLLDFVAVGHIDIATKRTSQQQMNEDGQVYWVHSNHAFGFLAKDGPNIVNPNQLKVAPKVSQEFSWPYQPVASSSGFGGTTAPGQGANRIDRTRFIFYK